MNDADRARHALDIGCPVRAARILLASTQVIARSKLAATFRGEWSLPLPAASPEAKLVAPRAGAQFLDPVEGVYALAVYRVDGEIVGSVQALVPGGDERADAFATSCWSGEQSAMRWITERVGPPRSSRLSFATQAVRPLALRDRNATRFGTSVGLAAALATAWHHLGRPGAEHGFVAATGAVDESGNVEAVEHVDTKIEAVRREAPFVRLVFVPRDAAHATPTRLGDLLVVPVKTVAEALEHLFRDPGLYLAALDPLLAAHKAVELEFGRAHGVAKAYAAAVLRAIPSSGLDDRARDVAVALACSVQAICATHEGAAHAAVDELRKLDETIWDGQRRHVVTLNQFAQLSAMYASALIDTLEYSTATEVCQRLDPKLEDIDPLPRMVLLGSWARALAAMGSLEEALDCAQRQRDVPLIGEDRHHIVQAHCNAIDIHLRRHGRGHADALPMAREHHRHAHEANLLVQEPGPRSANQRFLDLWECRITSLAGDLDRAAQLADAATSRRFPGHYMRRFQAAALAQAGLHADAISLLAEARRAIDPSCGKFERVILLTGGVLEARLRRDAGDASWQEAANELGQLLDAWCPGFVRWSLEGAAPVEWLDALDDAVRRLPY